MLYEDIDYSRVVIRTKDNATDTRDKEIEKHNETASKIVDNNLGSSQGYLAQTQEGIKIKKGHETELEKIRQERKNPLDFTELHSIQEIINARNDIIKKHLHIVLKSLECQTASIFLVSKDREIRHAGTAGFDKKNELVDFDCREEIADQYDELFGKAVKSEDNPDFNTSNSIDNLKNKKINEIFKSKYLGNLVSGTIVPLHGAHRIFGFLMVINKPNSSPLDMAFISELATSIAYRLSLFRSNTRINTQQYLIQKLRESCVSLNTIFQEVLDRLIKNPETPYRAGVIRIYESSSGLLKIQSISDFNLKSERRNNGEIKIGQGLAGLVGLTQNYLVLKDINKDENLCKFRNRDWIKENDLRIFCCFPMIAQDELIGTLSLYTSCNHGFHVEGLLFLQSITDSLASLMYSSRKYKLLDLMNDINLIDVIKFQNLLERLSDEFNESEEHIKLWLTSPHPDFGGQSPLYYLKQGKIDVVENLVEAIESGQIG